MNIFIIIISLLVISIPVVFAEPSNVGTIYWKQEIISSNSQSIRRKRLDGIRLIQKIRKRNIIPSLDER